MDSYRNRSCLDWSTAQRSTDPTPKIPSTLNISTCLQLQSPSTEKTCRSNLYNFPTATIPNTSKRIPPCCPVREKCITTFGNDISREEFPNGYAIYAFDLTPDICSSADHFNMIQRGNLAVDIPFSNAPTAAASLVCYGEFENSIHIDAERNVIYDYSG